jgi:uncharacterized membrane protein YbhN (UPF0104 family)
VKITWQRVLGLAVACLILFFMIRALRSELANLGTYQFTISGWRIAAAFGVFAVLFPVYGAIWQFIVAKFGYRISYRKSLRIWLVSQAGRYVPGKVWFALGRIYLSEREGVPKAVTTVATGLELVLVLGSSLVAFALASVARGSLRTNPYAWSVVLIPAIAVGVHPRIVGAVLGRLRKSSGELKMKYVDVLAVLAAYVACWCLYGVGFHLVATAVRLSGPGAPPPPALGFGLLPEMIAVNALSWTVGFISLLTPAGLGVREGVAFSLLSKFLDKPYPTLVPLAARVWVTVAEVGAIGLAVAMRGGRRR